MLFTVLQAVYKKDNPIFLHKALESIANSTLKPTSVIIVKDGIISPDLESVISEWETKLPLKIVGYNQNAGLAHALNFGLQFVNTELVARMDSDDICFPNRFEKQMEVFESNPHIEILGTGLMEFYNDKYGIEFSKKRMYPEQITSKSKSLYRGTPLGHPTVMIKTNLLKQFMYNENTNMNEDIELWFRLINNGHLINNLQEPLLYFRITDGTFKRRSMKKAFNEFKIYIKNLWSLFGFSPLLLYPIARFFVRFLPYTINKRLYFSKIRTNFLAKK